MEGNRNGTIPLTVLLSSMHYEIFSSSHSPLAYKLSFTGRNTSGKRHGNDSTELQVKICYLGPLAIAASESTGKELCYFVDKGY